ncbi:hypothetical protein D3879_19565 [Pseudomonas cavernicola]|uniref:Solute-binding protein family 3/N-terminal domain-containing protein n=1 Tax=Pseudomonas cavernicola TaxID=2320866 RepID=A0A418XCR4_9PSED|nr:transporter substrate-binding domain-containing protein [Pseudomonas cavernicola]RJG10227.1 hypothetical protein D3879_19565 [Pseudomonas cavernicola]
MKKFAPARLLASLLLTLAGGLCVSLPAVAEPSVAGDPALHFTEEANWPPFTEETHGLASKGLSYDLLQLVAKRMGRQADIELLPQQRIMQKLRQGEKDGATLVSYNDERASFLTFSDPILQKRGYVYYNVKRPLPIQFNDWRDLQGLLIGIVIGHNYGAAFDQARRELPLQVVEVVSVQQLFEMAKLGRVDAFLAIDLTALELMRRPEFSGQIAHAPRPYYEAPYFMALARHSAASQLLPQLNQAIGALKQSGELQALLMRYGIAQ